MGRRAKEIRLSTESFWKAVLPRPLTGRGEEEGGGGGGVVRPLSERPFDPAERDARGT